MKKYHFLHPDLLKATYENVKDYLPDCVQTPTAFTILYSAVNSMFFEVGDFEGVFWLSDVIIGFKANVHLVLWGDEVKKQHIRMRQILDEVISLLKLRRVQAYVPTMNEAVCELAEAMGFAMEGVLRKYEYYGGELVDVSLFALLKED